MCGVCGCSEPENTRTHSHSEQLVPIEQHLMAENARYAHNNQHWFEERRVLAVNLMSSPGSGKTTLLANSLSQLQPSYVIVGDQQTDEDARVLEYSGIKARQINTGKVCHLDAHMLGHALEGLLMVEKSFIFIENIGNLVCPALFKLGEHYNVVILSVTEGENKPLKYPEMFRVADCVLITKMDLLPHLDFNLALCESHIHKIQPNADIIRLSSKTGEGISQWLAWLQTAYSHVYSHKFK